MLINTHFSTRPLAAVSGPSGECSDLSGPTDSVELSNSTGTNQVSLRFQGVAPVPMLPPRYQGASAFRKPGMEGVIHQGLTTARKSVTGLMAGLALLACAALPIDQCQAAPAIPPAAVQAYENLTAEQKREIASQLDGTSGVLWFTVQNRQAFIDGKVGPVNVFNHLRDQLEDKRSSGTMTEDSFRRLSAALNAAEKLTSEQRKQLLEHFAPRH